MKHKKKFIGRWMGCYFDKEKNYKIRIIRKFPKIRFYTTKLVSYPHIIDKCISFEWLNFWGYIGIRYTEILK